MRTVDKALTLLGYFTLAEPQRGLSDVARAADLDKATTLRLLTSLQKHGFVEQNTVTKKFRLGSGILRYARIREACFPFTSVMQPVLERLSLKTGETVHVSLSAGSALQSIAVVEPQRPTRVSVDPSEPLPLHATASGIAYLAFANPETVGRLLAAAPLHRFLAATPTSAEELNQSIEQTRKNGYAVSVRTYGMDVVGLAAPIFDWSGTACGAVAVASLASRWDPEQERAVASDVVRASIEITRATGAEPPTHLVQIAGKLDP